MSKKLSNKLTKNHEALALKYIQKKATEKVVINILQWHLNSN